MPILTVSPGLDGSTIEWSASPTVSVGNQWTNVDDVPHDTDSTYNYASGTVAVGRIDLYAVSGGPIDPDATVNGIVQHMVARADAFDLTASFVLRTYGTNYFGADKSMSIGYSDFVHTWSTNPNTNQPWTPAEVNILQFGQQAVAVSASTQIRATSAYLVVDYNATFKRFISDGVSAADAWLRSEIPFAALFPSYIMLQISGSGAANEPDNAVYLFPLDIRWSKQARGTTIKIPNKDGGVVQWGGAEARQFAFRGLFIGDYISQSVKRKAIENLIWHTSSASLRARPLTLSIIVEGDLKERYPVILESYDLQQRRGRKRLWDVGLTLRQYTE